MDVEGSEPFRDAAGFAAFSDGSLGEYHVVAHRMLDEGRYEEGYHFLDRNLENKSGEGSEWIHLQWHAAVFAVATGRFEDALKRYSRYIAAAVPLHLALTDAPSLLWRLTMADQLVNWEAVRAVAAARTRPDGNLYVELHHALAFAGARDVDELDRWLDVHLFRLAQQRKLAGEGVEAPCPLLGVGWGLRLFANGDFEAAARLLDRTAIGVSTLGGSKAQNVVFQAIGREAEDRWKDSLALSSGSGC